MTFKCCAKLPIKKNATDQTAVLQFKLGGKIKSFVRFIRFGVSGLVTDFYR
jgi:hypothetical protein